MVRAGWLMKIIGVNSLRSSSGMTVGFTSREMTVSWLSRAESIMERLITKGGYSVTNTVLPCEIVSFSSFT